MLTNTCDAIGNMISEWIIVENVYFDRPVFGSVIKNYHAKLPTRLALPRCLLELPVVFKVNHVSPQRPLDFKLTTQDKHPSSSRI